MKFGTNLTEGPVFRRFIIFIVPIILSGFLQQLYSTADTMVVGKFAGSDALAAVGSTVALTNLILQLFIGLAVGANVVCACCYGAQDKQGLHRAIHTSILLAAVSGVILTFVGLFFSRTLLEMMSTDKDIIGQATLYMQVYFLGAPASLIYNFGAAILRAAGDTKRPLYILALSGVVNIVLNLFCVIVLEWGVVGVAVGTVVSQAFSAVVIIIMLKRTDSEFRLSFSKLRIYKKELGRIAATGIPSGLSGIMFGLSNVVIQTALNSWGKDVVAGNIAASNVESFGFLVLSAVEQGTISFVGQNMGAKNLKRVDTVTRCSLLVGFSGVVLFALAALWKGPALLGLFTDDASQEAVVNAGMIKMTIVLYSYILHAPNQILGGVMKGMGKALIVTIINTVFVCLLRVLWIVCIYPLNESLHMIYYSYPVTWGSSSVASIVAYIIIRHQVFKQEKRELAQHAS